MSTTEPLPTETDAWVVDRPGPVGGPGPGPLAWQRRPLEAPGPREILVEVEACGVCRTDLHLAEGDLSPRTARCTPGHEVVGRVLAVGADPEGFGVGDRAGVAGAAGAAGVRRAEGGLPRGGPGADQPGREANATLADFVCASTSSRFDTVS
ncbi:alcohol dehydrogenase catalytic domain-containing protein [Kitasatospora sp. NPDC001132]